MAADPQWILAGKRFGYGAGAEAPSQSRDPREVMLAEIADPGAALLQSPALASTAANQAAVFAYAAQERQIREMGGRQLALAALPSQLPIEIPVLAGVAPVLAAGADAPPMGANAMGANAMGNAMAPPPPTAGAMAPQAKTPERPEGRAYRTEAMARILKACNSELGFAERLVAFWSNHFCVSVSKSNLVHVCAGSFEREAIRPYVFGRFADMLRAVEQHPAMLHFLDNQQSVGPDSKAGKNRKAGLNENLAREIMELHTLGVGSGYTQADVTALARIITGWTSVGADARLGEPGTFAFNPNAHQPGAQAVLGKLYAQEGAAQGEAALDDLARAPATAAHIAKQLAKAFVADDPDPALVARLAKVFQDSDGDLAAVSKALAVAPEAWSAPPTKIRSPWEWMIGAYRAFGRPPADPGPSLNALRLLGQPLWQPAGPNGFSDDAAAWLSPEGLKTRVQLALQFARQAKNAPSPPVLAEAILGPSMSPETRETIARAESPEQAYALLLLAPEFMRR